jgi:hypothetical protein
MMVEANNMQTWKPCLVCARAPSLRKEQPVRNFGWAEDYDEGTTVNANVAVIREERQQFEEMPAKVGDAWVSLLDERPIGISIPHTSPALVSPTDTERKIGAAALKHLSQWALKQPSPGEPVVPVDEALNTCPSCQVGLGFPSFGNTEIIETEIGWQVRLVVSAKKGSCACGVRPFSESASPPLVILGNRMELRQIEGERSGTATRGRPQARGFRWRL